MKDLDSTGSELLENLVDFQGRLYFSATIGPETGLWRSDGTTPGTFPVVQIPSTGELLDRIREVTVVGNRIFFVAHVDELWVSDGTAAGTRRLKERSGGVIAFSSFAPPTPVGDTLFFFRLVTPAGGFTRTELWRSDGTPSGTVLVKDLGGGFRGSPTALGNKLFFAFEDAEHGTELWVSNGTSAGTRLVKDINPGPPGSSVASLTPGEGELYFAAMDPAHGEELWKTNGTARGTKLLVDIVPGPVGSTVRPFTVFEDRLYFTIRDPVHHTVRLLELRGGDSRHHRPVFLAGLLTLPADDPGRIDTFTLFPVISGDKLFFAFRSVAGIFPLQTSLWVTNGTRRGTRMLSSALPSPDEQPTSTHAPVGDGRVVFVAFDQEHGFEPWVSEGTLKGTRLLQDIKPGPDSSFPSRFTRSDGFIFFVTFTPFVGDELWALPLPRGGYDRGGR